MKRTANNRDDFRHRLTARLGCGRPPPDEIKKEIEALRTDKSEQAVWLAVHRRPVGPLAQGEDRAAPAVRREAEEDWGR